MNQKTTKIFSDFFRHESTSSLVLLFVTLFSFFIANSSLGELYSSLIRQWHLHEWINDGLMTFFFLLIGLEIERELYVGELANIKNALLPLIAALGGMAMPALIHFSLNYNTDTVSGFGIPVATDIAFSLAVLSALGKKIPFSLKIFLTALAIVDDLGAISLIVLFYSKGFSVFYFAASMVFYALLIMCNRLNVKAIAPYMLLALPMWYFMFCSGVHPTICGILIAFAVPFCDDAAFSPSHRLEMALQKPVAFVVLPLFALVNTGIYLDVSLQEALSSLNSLGIILGLVVGKPLGIVLFCYFAIRLKVCDLPTGTHFGQLLGVGLLAGIGFTMSIFIALLAFDDSALIQQSKLAILVGSTIAGALGYFILRFQNYRSI